MECKEKRYKWVDVTKGCTARYTAIGVFNLYHGDINTLLTCRCDCNYELSNYRRTVTDKFVGTIKIERKVEVVSEWVDITSTLVVLPARNYPGFYINLRHDGVLIALIDKDSIRLIDEGLSGKYRVSITNTSDYLVEMRSF